MSGRVELNREIVIGEMRRRDMTQNALAIRFGISKSYCSQLLRGQRQPSPTVRKKIQKVLGLSWEQVFAVVPANISKLDAEN